jgi:hypothetical protein
MGGSILVIGRISSFTGILSSVLLLVCFSCGRDRPGSTEVLGVDFTDNDIHDIFDYGIILHTDDPVDIVILLSSLRVRRCSFELDGREIETEWERDEEGWICELSGSQLPRNLDLAAGDSVSYYLDIDGNEFNGVIPIPNRPHVEWPPFDQSSAYTMAWQVANDPRVQAVDLEIEDDLNSQELTWQFSGETRQFEIPQENFSGYDPNDLKVRIELYCIGYHLAGECLAFGYQVERYLWYNSFGFFGPEAESARPTSETYRRMISDLF